MSPICKSSQFQEAAPASTQKLWPKSKIPHWLPSFPHDLTAIQVFPAEASDDDIVEQRWAIRPLPWILALQDAWAWPNGPCSMTLSYGAVDDQNTVSSFKHICISISFSIFHSPLFMFVVYSTLHNFVFYISFHVSFHLLLSHPGTFKSMVHIS